MRGIGLRHFIAATVVIAAGACIGSAQTADKAMSGRDSHTASRMTAEDVVRLAKAGLSDELILAQIRAKRASFDLTADQLVELKSSGVSERVIRAMLDLPASRSVPEEPTATAQKPDTQRAIRPTGIKASAAAPLKPAPSAAAVQWITHNDPIGFTLKAPSGWDVRADRQAGRVNVQGPQGQQAVIWPMFIPQQQLNDSSARILVTQLAHRVNPSIVWDAPKLGGDNARVFAHGQISGAAVIRWSSSPEGTTVFLFSATAPSAIYPASVDTFAGVLGSFRVVPDANTATAAGPKNVAVRAVAPPEQVAWIRWTDPREGAFSASVPQGWNVSGGAFRQSATDIRKSLVLLSPDRQIRVTFGDPNIGVYTAPNPMYARFGMREGGYTTVGDGSRLQIRRFLPAQQFVRQYLASSVSRECSDLHVLSGNERPDLATVAAQQARGQGAQSPRVTAAGASFSCTWNGREARGYYAAATVLPLPGRGGIWYVEPLYGFLATTERQQQADDISRHVLNSMGINATWQQREDQIAGNAVQQDNARSAEIQARARQAIAEDQQKTSDMIVKGYQARSQVYDEIARKRENAILGTVDVIDPSSGKQYKIDNYSDYHWMNNQGVIAGTKTDSAPGPDWREMITLP